MNTFGKGKSGGAESSFHKINRLAKWRTVLTGWQLGTRAKGDPESDAVRNHLELTLLLRAEVSALARLLIEKKIVTSQEWDEAVGDEADHLSTLLEKRFPGFKASDDGIEMDSRAAETMKGWRP